MKVLFLDMDGVLADFDKGIQDWYGITFSKREKRVWDYDYKAHNLTAKDFWEGLRHEFWEDLEWLPEGRGLFAMLSRFDPVIVTAPPWSSPGAVEGKAAWLKKHLPKLWKERRFAFASNKFHFAFKGAVLIDDREENVDKFVAADGDAILYPQPWNRNRRIKGKSKNAFVADMLASYTD